MPLTHVLLAIAILLVKNIHSDDSVANYFVRSVEARVEWHCTECSACFRRSNIKNKLHDDVDAVDDDDFGSEAGDRDDRIEDVGRSESTSLIRRVEKTRNVRSLLRAVNEAALRVNPGDPDAFLSLLSTRVGHAEQLDDVPDIYDQSVQTDQPLPLQVDFGSSARLKQLQREMVDLKSQQQISEFFTYIMAPIAVILMLLFAGKLWAAMHTGVDVAK